MTSFTGEKPIWCMCTEDSQFDAQIIKLFSKKLLNQALFVPFRQRKNKYVKSWQDWNVSAH